MAKNADGGVYPSAEQGSEFSAGLAEFLPYRFSLEFEPVSTVDDAIENAVDHGGIADLLVPTRDRYLGSQDHGAALTAVIADFEEPRRSLSFSGAMAKSSSAYSDFYAPQAFTQPSALAIANSKCAKPGEAASSPWERIIWPRSPA